MTVPSGKKEILDYFLKGVDVENISSEELGLLLVSWLDLVLELPHNQKLLNSLRGGEHSEFTRNQASRGSKKEGE